MGDEREGKGRKEVLGLPRAWESAERLSGTDQHGFCSPAPYSLDDATLP